ncbi:sulfurtransferase complex subunit TusB [Vibrio ostreicida]|uniref:Sulfurtransferase complex subunit TusB n=1 Tax=Vibrio ostreicida TaxID=526588 RepID=A0ABT8BPH6_9VIBR|nr:sulfurtransferase complex subunit TusB [Vibrio ostreicida]MDN3608344.1 sulfurtransferase complex subunit TusB [Vibrio ostreicida]NPD10814.1 sulfurtransferase complex subunit TusB [Vibrio ostreicida]
MLHIVKSAQALEDVRKAYSEADALILIEDAVYVANSQHRWHPLIKGLNASVLANDLKARGALNGVSPSIHIVDYEGFVDLTVEQESSLTWD